MAEGFEPTLMAALQVALGHDFERIEHLERALTHASFKNERADVAFDNERLEFLGDAVLELIVSALLFRAYPELPEGKLTQFRARVVNAKTLSSMARNLSIGALLRLGVGEERMGGRSRESLLADAFEAVLGAVYLDAGYEVAQRVVTRLYRGWLSRLEEGAAKDVKSRLQEWAQEHHRVTPQYRVLRVEGPDHASVFEVEVSVGDLIIARGEGPSKKEAQRQAAAQALEAIAPARKR